MSDQITAILKNRLDELSSDAAPGPETLRNCLKEVLQYYVLNFVYHHPDFGHWVMYGGSALRIIHGLDRMSVDLDFETAQPVTAPFLEKLKKEAERHFLQVHGADPGFMTAKITTGRGLLLKFHVGDLLGLGHSSRQVHVKLDLNHFVAPKTVHERRPINQHHLSFVILTYNMASLMASKIAAIFLRGRRGVGKAVYEEKSRDIYDLLWYMGKKVEPDFDYLIAKGVDVKDPCALFKRLTLQMNKVKDENLKQDLEPLFMDKSFIKNWLRHWRETYFRLLEDYAVCRVKDLERIVIHYDFDTLTYSFAYFYVTEEDGSAEIVYKLSDNWVDLREGELSSEADEKLEDKIEIRNGSRRQMSADRLKRYAALFFRKNEAYFRKTNRVILGSAIRTKVIRMTSDRLNQREQIVLNRAALISCELDDLVK